MPQKLWRGPVRQSEGQAREIPTSTSKPIGMANEPSAQLVELRVLNELRNTVWEGRSQDLVDG